MAIVLFLPVWIGGLGKKPGLAVLYLNISDDTNLDYPSQPIGNVPQGNGGGNDHIMAYVLIPLGALVLIALLSFLVSIVIISISYIRNGAQQHAEYQKLSFIVFGVDWENITGYTKLLY